MDINSLSHTAQGCKDFAPGCRKKSAMRRRGGKELTLVPENTLFRKVRENPAWEDGDAGRLQLNTARAMLMSGAVCQKAVTRPIMAAMLKG